jgi:hypothetical protein
MPFKDPQKQRESEKRYKERNAEKVKMRDKIYRANHKVETRSYHVKRNYGISIVQYDYMLASQNWRCAICNNLATPHVRLAIDHCHITGRIRGLLCHKCNPKVEKFEAYLKRPDPFGKPVFVPVKISLDKDC